MADPSNAAEYRRKAAACLEVAKRSSLREDHALMTDMAQRWLVLAQKAEAMEGAQPSGQQQQQHGQQPALQQQQVQPKKDESGTWVASILSSSTAGTGFKRPRCTGSCSGGLLPQSVLGGQSGMSAPGSGLGGEADSICSA
jgi:hypothetical protein